jgi:solute:Na+ symporter, SSS family
MTPTIILICVAVYFAALLVISYLTSRSTSAEGYFLGNKQSPWYAVAFGMVGDSLSGVTFISVPGAIYYGKFGYLQLVVGYFVGYFVISRVLLPIYYSRNLTSIYEYLRERFGTITQRTGAFFFLISRLLGAGGRLFLAANVLQLFVFDAFNIPFALSVAIIIVLILIYTYRGGIQTLVWTDVFQSSFLLLAVLFSIMAIANAMQLGVLDVARVIKHSDYNQILFIDINAKNFVLKNFIGGLFIAVAMTGLDQNMMQKNLSCKSLADSQKNIEWFSVIMVLVNMFFVCLGALLYAYMQTNNIALPMNADGTKVLTDTVFPSLALNHLGLFAGIVFIIGLTAATFSSADSVLTSLTTTVYIDFLNLDRNTDLNEQQKSKKRTVIHTLFAFVLLLCILGFAWLNDAAIVNTVLMLAGYTYGPLLGLFGLGLFSKVFINDKIVPLACVIAPVMCYFINDALPKDGYQIGMELILVNALITVALLLGFTKITTAITTK